MSIAMVYNAERRNNGTAVLCWDALKRGLNQPDLIRYQQGPGIAKGHSLYLHIDDGRDDIAFDFAEYKPNAFWAIDTHLGYEARLKKARMFDWVFTAQKDGAERMRADGIANVEWLPLACHPPACPNYAELLVHPALSELQGNYGMDKQHDVVFVGYINTAEGEGFHNRLEYLDTLFHAYPNFWLTTNCFFEEMAIRYVRGRVGVNISIRNDLNMRFFEVLSTGTCLLTNRDVLGIGDLGFVEGEHFLGYEGKDEMLDQVAWALAHPVEREDIAKRGCEKVRAGHTYVDRMKVILSKFGVEHEG